MPNTEPAPPVVRDPLTLLNAIAAVWEVSVKDLKSSRGGTYFQQARMAFWWHWCNNSFGPMTQAASYLNRSSFTASAALRNIVAHAKRDPHFLTLLRRLHVHLKRLEP